MATKKPIDWKQFDKLCALQCTKLEIAAFFDMSDAGTFRTYVFVYSGTITGLGSSATTTNWRVRFVTKHRSTYLSLYVFIDNTQ